MVVRTSQFPLEATLSPSPCSFCGSLSLCLSPCIVRPVLLCNPAQLSRQHPASGDASQVTLLAECKDKLTRLHAH